MLTLVVMEIKPSLAPGARKLGEMEDLDGLYIIFKTNTEERCKGPGQDQGTCLKARRTFPEYPF